MRTNFTAEQLADPETAEMQQILRSCVHCGLCTANCPSYSVLGDELDGPRGRIGLIQDALEGEKITPALVTHMDRCLSCLACMTVCPSGVDYMHLADLARTKIESAKVRPWRERTYRAFIYYLTRHSFIFRLTLFFGLFGKLFAWLLPKKIKPALAFTPIDLRALVKSKATHEVIHPALGPTRLHAAAFTGCAQQVLAPEIDAATMRLLTRHDIELTVIRGAGCCGSMPLHLGKREEARNLAEQNIRALPHNADFVIANAAGCGLAMKDYGHLLSGEERAQKFSTRVLDVSEMIQHLGYRPLAKPPGAGQTIAWHGACALQHGQGIDELPRHLLTQAGYRVVQPRDPHACCGWAGTYHLFQNKLSLDIRARKAEALNACGADMIVSGNMGCLMHLAPELKAPCAHFVQLLDWASGGPPPKPFA